MRRSFIAPICSIGLLFASYASTVADPEECQDALDKYRSAKSDVESTLSSYSRCIGDSNGHDDCSSEFSSLRSSQDDFESAVSAYTSDCD